MHRNGIAPFDYKDTSSYRIITGIVLSFGYAKCHCAVLPLVSEPLTHQGFECGWSLGMDVQNMCDMLPIALEGYWEISLLTIP